MMKSPKLVTKFQLILQADSFILDNFYFKIVMRDFPGGPVAKTLHSQCMGPGFNIWSGNQIPHAATKSSHAAAKDPACRSEDPVCQN